jgi:hypothetical protein
VGEVEHFFPRPGLACNRRFVDGGFPIDDNPIDRDFLCRQTERYQSILEVTKDTVGSSDIFEDPRSSILDLAMIRAVDRDLAKVINWNDNEWNCANQMVREALRVEG